MKNKIQFYTATIHRHQRHQEAQRQNLWVGHWANETVKNNTTNTEFKC